MSEESYRAVALKRLVDQLERERQAEAIYRPRDLTR